MSIFNRTPFQGNLRRRNYFEGWYFKNVSSDCETIYSFIPGVSLDRNDPHAFIQVIDGATARTAYVRFDLSEFFFSRKYLYVSIGANEFSANRIHLDIDTPDIKVKGTLEYSDLTILPSSLTMPGIMGWFSYLPFMECNHEVVSADHRIDGSLEIGGVVHDFSDGRGYTEKDWGCSFPSAWFWLQCNNFPSAGINLFVSVASIPAVGRSFTGLIAFVLIDGVFYRFATYNHSRISRCDFSDGRLNLVLESKLFILTVNAQQGEGGRLLAPVSGTMNRGIKESVNSTVNFVLTDRSGKLIAEDAGTAAGFEITDGIIDIVRCQPCHPDSFANTHQNA